MTDKKTITIRSYIHPSIQYIQCILPIYLKINKIIYLLKFIKIKVIAGLSNKQIVVFDVNQQIVNRTLVGHTNTVWNVKMLSDGITLSSGSADKSIKLWNIFTGTLLKTLTGHTAAVYYLDQLPNGNLISGSGDYSIKVWNLTTYTVLITIAKAHSAGKGVWVVKTLPNGNFASSGGDNNVRVWHGTTYALVFILSGHVDLINDMTVLSDGRLASCSYDGTVRIWNTTSGIQLLVFNPLNNNKIYYIRQVSSNPIVVACVGDSSNVAFWNMQGQFGQVAPKPGGLTAYLSIVFYNSTLMYVAAWAQLQAFNPTSITSGSISNLIGSPSSASVLSMDKLSIERTNFK